MSWVGQGAGSYVRTTTYRYVGYGGDFDMIRNRNVCVIIPMCLLPLLLLLGLLWWFSQPATTAIFDCDKGLLNWERSWSKEQQQYCCSMYGRGCTTTPKPLPIIPTVPPPTAPPTTPATTRVTTRSPSGPVDPYNCAVGAVDSWDAGKKAWCCNVHHIGCPTFAPVIPTLPPVPADPYNCAEGYENWESTWSVAKKSWCCRVHGRGCPTEGGGCATSGKPFDCNAGLANWMAGWSIAKKAWCCKNEGKGCPTNGGGCA